MFFCLLSYVFCVLVVLLLVDVVAVVGGAAGLGARGGLHASVGALSEIPEFNFAVAELRQLLSDQIAHLSELVESYLADERTGLAI